MLWDIFKTALKFLILTAVVYFSINQVFPTLMKFSSLNLYAIFNEYLSLSAALIAKLAVVLIFIAIIDLLYTKWEYLEKQRMTKKEVKDEMKRRDGDPTIKQKRRELEQELRNRSGSVNNVQEADLLITNPTRFAVALKFDRQLMIAPKIIGLGSGGTAKKMREKAVLHKVPIIRVPKLARKLFKTGKFDGYIPEDCYFETAKVYKTAFSINGKII